MSSIERQLAEAAEQIYVPCSTLFSQCPRKVHFCIKERPDEVCGVALRVGRAGTRGNDPPIYRLKLKTSMTRFKTVTLAGFFVLEKEVFIPYQLWRRRRRR